MTHLNRNHHRVFYGWWIVGACFLISVYIAGTVHFGFTAIFEPIANEFDWSYAQISLAASLRGVEVGLLAPVVGLLVDRWGPRRLIFVAAIINGLGLMLLSRITSIGMFYGAFVLISLGMSASTGTVMMTAVANWFRKKMATATGIMTSGVGLGGLLVPLVVLLIDIFEWRMTMVILSLGMWGIVLPLSLLVRHKPEQYGYLPDGEVSSARVAGEGLKPGQTAEVDIGAKQALASRTFWHIALALMCGGLAISAMVTHVMPYLSSIGIARSTSGLMASAIPVASIAGRLGFGWLGDRLNKRRTVALSFTLMSLGLFFFGYVASGGMWLLVPALILFGTGYGGNVSMTPALLREYFGRSRFGTILGFTFGIIMVGQIVGPPLAGWVFDNWGSYQGIWFAIAALVIAAIVIVVTTPPVGKAIRTAGNPKDRDDTIGLG